MPKIDTEPKLDFEQVLIRPKRSELNSRSEVDLTRTITFKNPGIPGQACPSSPPTCRPLEHSRFAKN